MIMNWHQTSVALWLNMECHMKVKESILQEIENYIDGRIDELSELAKKYAEIDNYIEIARLKEMKQNVLTFKIF